MDGAHEDEFSASEDGRMDSVDDDEITEAELEDDILLADNYRAANSYGTTPEEAREGESLERQLAQEEPDVPPDSVDDEWPDGPGPRAGQLVAEGEDMADELAADDDMTGEETAVHETEASDAIDERREF